MTSAFRRLIVGLTAVLALPAAIQAQTADAAKDAPEFRPRTFGAAVAALPAEPVNRDADASTWPVRSATPRTPPQAPSPPSRLDNGFDQSPTFRRMRTGENGTATPRPGRDAFRARPGTYAPSFDAAPGIPSGDPGRRGSGGRPTDERSSPVVLVAPPYGPYAPWDMPRAVRAEASAGNGPEVPRGFLRLLIEPRGAAVFVDGVYEGTADDFGGSGERSMPAGTYRVRLQAEAYEPLSFDVRVPANDTVTFRRELDPRVVPAATSVEPGATTPSAPAPRKTFYVIPRCFLGDTPPQPEQLPAGCRIADMKTLP